LKNRWIIIERSERKQKPIEYKNKSPIQRPSKITETSESENKQKYFWQDLDLDDSWLIPESNVFW
jgi:hypothetical protein